MLLRVSAGVHGRATFFGRASSRFCECATGDLADIAEMEDGDVEELIQANSIPKLTARRLRKALIEIGAKIEP